MILSLLVWLAMQGQVQAQTPDLSQLGDPGIVRPLTCNYCGQYAAPLPKCSDSVTTDCDCGKAGCAVETPKPAEHVIEIKTRREKRTFVILPKRYSADYLQGFKEGCEKFPQLHGKFVNGVCEQTVSRPVIRELWIDGVRWGVVKGLD